MKIKLKKLTIENFKGIKNMVVEFGDKANVYGDNATGKTTLADAFNWLLFNKDSKGAEKFSLRPLTKDNKRIDNIEIRVIAIMEVDGEEVTLDKIQKQNWVTKRGTKVSELQGNPNSYEIDGIPKSESIYKQYIDSIINEDLFKLITNPSTFPSLPWKKQREALMGMVSMIDDVDIAKGNKEFEPLVNQLEKFSVDDLTAKAQKALKEYKKQQTELPSRIDEVSKSIIEVDLEQEELTKKSLLEQILEIERQEETASLGFDKVNQISDSITSLKISRSEIERNASETLRSVKDKLESDKRDAERRFETAFNEHKFLDEAIVQHTSFIARDKQNVEELRESYKTLQDKELDINSTKCAVCGQELPIDQIEKIHNEFNSKKQAQLEEIQKKGKALNEDIARLTEQIASYNAEIEICKKEKMEANKQKAGADAKLQNLVINDPKQDQGYIDITNKIELLEKQLSEMNTGADYRKQLKEQKATLNEELREVMSVLASKDSNDRARIRIKELETEQSEVGQKVADQEQVLYLLESFIQEKMNLLSSRVNELFEVADWKLFELQQNGGMKETCECTVKGVPYADVNSAGKIQVGLDIINTLSRINSASAPIWIDNREGVTSIPDTEAQIINLHVSKKDKTLRIESEE